MIPVRKGRTISKKIALASIYFGIVALIALIYCLNDPEGDLFDTLMPTGLVSFLIVVILWVAIAMLAVSKKVGVLKGFAVCLIMVGLVLFFVGLSNAYFAVFGILVSLVGIIFMGYSLVQDNKQRQDRSRNIGPGDEPMKAVAVQVVPERTNGERLQWSGGGSGEGNTLMENKYISVACGKCGKRYKAINPQVTKRYCCTNCKNIVVVEPHNINLYDSANINNFSSSYSFIMRMRWFRFYTYGKLPTYMCMYLNEILKTDILILKFVNFFSLVLSIFVMIGLLQKKLWGWELNVLLLISECYFFSFNITDMYVNDIVLFSEISVLIYLAFLFFLPNYIYFKKRIKLFS